MAKYAYCMFDTSDYTERQEEVLQHLTEKYPRNKWRQLLSPFHCQLIYDGLLSEERDIDIYETFDWLIQRYGKITVQLDYALRMYVQRFRGRKEYEESYFQLKGSLGKDGDELATAIMKELDLGMLPTREHVRQMRELDVENFILREPFDMEGLHWCLEFCGFNMDNCNIVNIWNSNKDRYEKSKQDDFAYED